MFSTVDSETNLQLSPINEKPTNITSNAPGSGQQKNCSFYLMLIMEVFLLAALLGTTIYEALPSMSTNQFQKPQRFFSVDSIVSDWYNGQVSRAMVEANLADVSFVMFYAPWNAECQYVRGEFEKAASVLHDRVHFSAVNCWQPGSECRVQNKIMSWPVIMAYTTNTNGILYRGIKEAHDMVKFLELITTPTKRISSAEDLVNILSKYDAVAVAYTPLRETPKYYNIWNSAAIQMRNYDTAGDLCFASVTSEVLANDLGVDVFPSIRYMLWNVTKEYGRDPNETWNVTSIESWLYDSYERPIHRLMPDWVGKSFSFEKVMSKRPVLFMFTPLNPLYEVIPMYALLREITMEYFNCPHNQWVTEMIKLKQANRLIYQQKNLTKFCQDFQPNKNYKYEVLSHHNKYPWTNVTKKSQKSNFFETLLKHGFAISSSSDERSIFTSGNPQDCSNMMLTDENQYDQCNMLHDALNNDKKIIEILQTTMVSEDDPLSASNLFQDHISHMCKLHQFAQERGPPIYPENVEEYTPILGLGCQANHSLLVVVMDSVRNHHFAEVIGVDIVNVKDMTAVVILDSVNESQYVLSKNISAKTIRDFISDFTAKRLKRTLRTQVKNASHTHHYTAMNPETNTVEIVDLTSHTFTDFVNTPDMLSIILICDGGCKSLVSSCAARATRLLREGGARAQLGRLDVRRHDAPWSYTPHRLPALLVTPCRNSEAESLVYPIGKRITAGGIVGVALRALSPPLHLSMRLKLCSLEKLTKEKTTCIKDLRQHVTTLIGRHLKYWRLFQDLQLKKIILIRLQSLHSVSFQLDLLHETDIETYNSNNSLITSLRHLTDLWNPQGLILRRNITHVKDPL